MSKQDKLLLTKLAMTPLGFILLLLTIANIIPSIVVVVYMVFYLGLTLGIVLY